MTYQEIIDNLPKPYYRDEQADIAIYCGDCRELLPLLPAKDIDLVLTDPPYGVGKDYGNGCKDDLPTFVSSISLVVSLNIKAVIFCPVSRLFDLPVRPEWLGIWRKNWTGLALRSYPFYPHWEALAFYHLKGDYAGNKGHRSDIFEVASIRPDPKGHPSPKPEALLNELILFMNGQLILDPFLGSGTTLVCAKKLGRKAIGIEIEEKYCQIAVERLRQSVMKLEID